MSRFGKFVAGGMLLLMLGAPAMACLAPDAQLSDAEKACCRRMANDCGSMHMPSRHSCCQTTVKPQQSAMLKPAANLSYDKITVDSVAITSAAAIPQQAAMGSDVIRAWRHPPPGTGLFSPSIQILRI